VRIHRRELLRLGLVAGAGIFSGASVRGLNTKKAQEARKPKLLTPYVDVLPVPEVIRPAARGESVLQIRAREFHGKVHRDLPPTRLWGYNGMWPGPTIEVRRGQALSVKWTNELPRKHFLPIDTSIHGSEEGVPEVRTVVHVHGAQVLPESDGYPEAWTVPGESALQLRA